MASGSPSIPQLTKNNTKTVLNPAVSLSLGDKSHDQFFGPNSQDRKWWVDHNLAGHTSCPDWPRQKYSAGRFQVPARTGGTDANTLATFEVVGRRDRAGGALALS
jgi:hypothetical protein